jgi:tetratricopeptide (TPR) repeat protein
VELIMRPRHLLLVALVTLAAGCGNREQAARSAVARGDAYMRDGRAAAAVIEYRNALQKQPTRAEAYRKLGDAQAAQGNAEEAYRAYCRAIDVDPDDSHSRVEAGRLLFGAGRYTEALLRAEQTLERNERSADAAVLASRALAKMNRTDEALAQLDATLASDPTPSAYAALGDIRLALGDRAAAEAAYRKAVALSPQSAEARIALAQYLSANGRTDDAEAAFKAAIAANGADEVANRALAAFYASIGKDAAAEPYLRAAAALPNQKLKSTLALADYYLAAERYDDARRVLEPVTSGPMLTDAKVRLAAVTFHTGSAADARKQLDRLMEKRPTAEAWTLKAQMLQADQKTDDALAAAQAAVDLDPSALVAQYIVGSIELDRGNYDAAETAFRAVIRDRKWELAGTIQLARVKLAAGHPAEAVTLAESAGDDLTARLTLARALIADGQSARARRELQALAAATPSAPEPAVLLGTMALTDGNVREARAQAARALSLAPNAGDALLLSARCAMADGDASSAEQYLNRAAASSPDSFDAPAMLANLYAGRGDLPRAQRTLEQFIAKHADVAAARTALGIVFESQNKPKEARAAYEAALALDPVEPVASNNLARLYAPDDAQVPRALELARTAASKLPDDADAHDTLGWIAFKAGRLSLAASELERAVALNGNDASYKEHLKSVRAAIEEAARADAEAARAQKSEQQKSEQ